jgi:hypothetical protein
VPQVCKNISRTKSWIHHVPSCSVDMLDFWTQLLRPGRSISSCPSPTNHPKSSSTTVLAPWTTRGHHHLYGCSQLLHKWFINRKQLSTRPCESLCFPKASAQMGPSIIISMNYDRVSVRCDYPFVPRGWSTSRSSAPKPCLRAPMWVVGSMLRRRRSYRKK